jgi:hypothetical protein
MIYAKKPVGYFAILFLAILQFMEIFVTIIAPGHQEERPYSN